MTDRPVGPSDDFDEASFDSEYNIVSRAAAERAGFAVEERGIRILTVHDRLLLAQSRARAAHELVTDVQQWLIDEDPRVRRAAREGLETVLRRIYIGDRNPREGASQRRHGRLDGPIAHIDALLEKQLSCPDPDLPDPAWRRPDAQLRIRALLIVSMLAFASTAGLLIGLGHLLAAIPLMVCAASVDVIEGAFARVSENRSAGMRWFSCVSSHSADALLIWAVALHTSSTLVLAALVLSIMGAFVRVSALQAGRRLWASPEERAIRFTAVLGYCVLALVGSSAAGALLAAALVGVSGLREVFLAVWAVYRGPGFEIGELVFVEPTADARSQLHRYSLASDRPEPAELGRGLGARTLHLASNLAHGRLHINHETSEQTDSD